MFPIIVTSLDSTDNKHDVCRKAAGILLLGVWCKNIRYNIPIITLVGVWPDGLSPLEKLGHPRAIPRVTLLYSGRQTVGSHSNKVDNCIIVASLDSTDNKHGIQRQVRRCRRRRNCIYYIKYFRKAAGILLLGVWCKNIRYNIPIITLVGVWSDGLSPLSW